MILWISNCPRSTTSSVSIYLPEKVTATTVHFWGQHETYISEPGDFTAKADIPNAKAKSSWYWLAGVEVWASEQTAATVAFGDSITDGVGAKQGDYTDWPDMLARRLGNGQGASALAVVNEGIGGNRVLYDGAGVNALARLDRDVCATRGGEPDCAGGHQRHWLASRNRRNCQAARRRRKCRLFIRW